MRILPGRGRWSVLSLSLAASSGWAAQTQTQASVMLASPTVIRGVQVGVEAPRLGVVVDVYGQEGWSVGAALDVSLPTSDQTRERSGALRFSAPLWRRGGTEIGLSAQLQAFDGMPTSRRWNYLTLGATAQSGPWALSWFVVPSSLAAERTLFAGQAVDLAWQYPLTGAWSLDLSGGWVDVRTARPGRYLHGQIGVVGSLGRAEWRAAWGRTDAAGQRLFGPRAEEGYRLSFSWGL